MQIALRNLTLKKTLILASNNAIKRKLYEKYLNLFNIGTIIPNNDQQLIVQMLLNALNNAIWILKMKKMFNLLKELKIDCCILDCAEFSIFFDKMTTKPDILMIDSNKT